MADVTIDDIPQDLYDALLLQAKRNNRSPEDEVLHILIEQYRIGKPPRNNSPPDKE